MLSHLSHRVKMSFHHEVDFNLSKPFPATQQYTQCRFSSQIRRAVRSCMENRKCQKLALQDHDLSKNCLRARTNTHTHTHRKATRARTVKKSGPGPENALPAHHKHWRKRWENYATQHTHRHTQPQASHCSDGKMVLSLLACV